MYCINIVNHSKFVLFFNSRLIGVSIQPFCAGTSHQVEAYVIGSQMYVGYIFCMKKAFILKTAHIVTKEFLNL